MISNKTKRIHKNNTSIKNSNENGRSDELRRGPWTLDEDNLLIQYITCHGEGRWNSLAKYSGLNRTGKSCRLRWLNYLKPDIKRGNLTPHEQILILELHSKWGNRWSKIAQHLPGRTDNEIKNYWRTRVQKQARQLKIDSNSKKFLEAIRMHWMPRLLEKIEQNNNNNINNNNSSTSSSSVENNNQGELPSSDGSNSKPIISNAVNNNSSDGNYSELLTAPISNYNGEKLSLGKDHDCYYVAYDEMRELESSQDISMSECHVDGIDWLGEDLVESTFWNTADDGLWQF
ncbi:hypothetical protein ACP275_12G077300 [Erythranthe tilingii]